MIHSRHTPKPHKELFGRLTLAFKPVMNSPVLQILQWHVWVEWHLLHNTASQQAGTLKDYCMTLNASSPSYQARCTCVLPKPTNKPNLPTVQIISVHPSVRESKSGGRQTYLGFFPSSSFLIPSFMIVISSKRMEFNLAFQ